MRNRNSLRAVELAKKIFRIFISSIGYQSSVDRKYERIDVKRVGSHDRSILRHCIDFHFDGLTTVLCRHVNVVEGIRRPLLAPFAVERIAIADILSKLVKDLDILIVGPNLFVGYKWLECVVLAQLLDELRA